MMVHAPRMVTTALILTLATLAAVCRAAPPAFVSFPGSQSELASPNGLHRLVNFDATTVEEAAILGDSHAIMLEPSSSSKTLWRLSYPRHVSVGWSPQGTKFVVNNHYASNASSCVLFVLKDRKEIDIGHEARTHVPGAERLFRNDHVYVTGEKWMDEDVLLVSISGYGEQSPAGFLCCLRYSLDRGFEPAAEEECRGHT